MQTLQTVARSHCPYCRAEGSQSWEADIARPAVVWSQCPACAQISIWEQGARAFPPTLPGARARLPLTAQAALLVAAYRGREETFARIANARDAVATAERHIDAALHFLALFTRYDTETDDAPGGRLSIAG